mmetsp:Transcript_17331/g.56729  ORF Transcript_17331/g.56729 Transcript_17331/m.56729 type:complete len:282 (-) Transcript_17331:39-884(-)|eukprot:CAMPEP_0170143422 /NCGR_PEP_ID=MMETSP0033_2-20121228/10889_1 /TAXON_ID=195969 /ORGANISM="Dolichomastix tenuilepis, Strain CCMP3274" /LENGTH=281 /DNA_ID=CAMNT_0010379869 /DNA_START=19 /DNA_END=864 /DNA_ORIENTATION=+
MAALSHAGCALSGLGARDARRRSGARGAVVTPACSSGGWSPSSARPEAGLIAEASRQHGLVSMSGDMPIVASQGKEPPSPYVMERFQATLTQLFPQRIIRMGGAVDDEMANMIVAQLLYLDASDPKADITMYVNSPGGSVTAGMAIFDTMRHVRPNVSTVCCGLAASMGAFLLASGQKGKRYSLPNSRIMIHQPLGGAQGQADDIEIQANEIMHHKLTLNGYLAEFSGKSLETIMADTDRDFFMSAAEAVEYGLIDGVIETNTNTAVKSSGIEPFASTYIS